MVKGLDQGRWAKQGQGQGRGDRALSMPTENWKQKPLPRTE